MSDVGQWDPTASVLTQRHKRLLENAADQLDADDLGLSPDEQALMRPVMQLDKSSWLGFCEAVADEDIIRWIKVFTLLEERLSGFEGGAKSPVIALVNELKNRNSYPVELTAWVKANSSNRFLPYGSLMDRL